MCVCGRKEEESSILFGDYPLQKYNNSSPALPSPIVLLPTKGFGISSEGFDWFLVEIVALGESEWDQQFHRRTPKTPRFLLFCYICILINLIFRMVVHSTSQQNVGTITCSGKCLCAISYQVIHNYSFILAGRHLALFESLQLLECHVSCWETAGWKWVFCTYLVKKREHNFYATIFF